MLHMYLKRMCILYYRVVSVICVFVCMCIHICTHIHLHIHEVKFADCVIQVFYIYIGLLLYCYSVNCWQRLLKSLTMWVIWFLISLSTLLSVFWDHDIRFIQIKNCYIFLVNWPSSQNTFCLNVCLVSYEYNYTDLLSIGVHFFFPFATLLYPYAIMHL